MCRIFREDRDSKWGVVPDVSRARDDLMEETLYNLLVDNPKPLIEAVIRYTYRWRKKIPDDPSSNELEQELAAKENLVATQIVMKALWCAAVAFRNYMKLFRKW